MTNLSNKLPLELLLFFRRFVLQYVSEHGAMSSIFFSLLSHIDLAFSSLCVRLSSLNSFSLARFRRLAPAIPPPCSHGEKKGGIWRPANGRRKWECGPFLSWGRAKFWSLFTGEGPFHFFSSGPSTSDLLRGRSSSRLPFLPCLFLRRTVSAP